MELDRTLVASASRLWLGFARRGSAGFVHDNDYRDDDASLLRENGLRVEEDGTGPVVENGLIDRRRKANLNP